MLVSNSAEAPPPTTSDVLFQHTPLDLHRKQLRLLRITQTDFSEIKCELENFTCVGGKQDTPPYWALSYVWGAESPIYHISVNGKPYPIRPNLHNFLQERRLQSDDKYIWIDQICINQRSVDERNHQVSIMSEIYRNAYGVITWLGKRDEEAELGLRCFQELQNPYYCDLSEFLHLPAGTTARKANIGKWVLVNGGSKLKEEVIRSINVIFRNPFWTRLWIVQEVLLGRTVIVQQGSLWFHLDAMPRFERMGFRQDGLIAMPEVVLTTRGHTAIWSRQRDLKWMISEFCEFGCQDPRDKVYGLVGVVECGTTVPVDYRKSAEEVFIDVVIAFSHMWMTETREPDKAREDLGHDVQTLYRLVVNMIPDKVDRYFEKRDQDRFRFRMEMLDELWRTTKRGKNDDRK